MSVIQLENKGCIILNMLRRCYLPVTIVLWEALIRQRFIGR